MSKPDSPSSRKVPLEKRSERVRVMEVLERRRQAILGELKIVESEIAANRAYIRELDRWSGALPEDRRLNGKVSIRDMILQVLRDRGKPMTVVELLKGIEALHGRELARSSVSPVLSKMSARGEVKKEDGARWSIP
jgi:hypothetical protein